jgi:hypothetical protein
MKMSASLFYYFLFFMNVFSLGGPPLIFRDFFAFFPGFPDCSKMEQLPPTRFIMIREKRAGSKPPCLGPEIMPQAKL